MESKMAPFEGNRVNSSNFRRSNPKAISLDRLSLSRFESLSQGQFISFRSNLVPLVAISNHQ